VLVLLIGVGGKYKGHIAGRAFALKLKGNLSRSKILAERLLLLWVSIFYLVIIC